MDPETILDVARELVLGSTEAHWRASAGRAYYAGLWKAWNLMEGWGLPVPRNDSVHKFMRLRLTYASDADLQKVGKLLGLLGELRTRADYGRVNIQESTSPQRVKQSILQAEQVFRLIDQVDAVSPRVTTAVADIRARWP